MPFSYPRTLAVRESGHLRCQPTRFLTASQITSAQNDGKEPVDRIIGDDDSQEDRED
jgi:hypothetical protein